MLGRHLMWLLLLVPAVAGQGAIEAHVAPMEGAAPLTVFFELQLAPGADADLLTSWELVDGEMTLGGGTTMPASFNHTFDAGTHELELRYVYDGGIEVEPLGTIDAKAPAAPGDAGLIAKSVWPLLVAGLLMIALSGYLLVKDISNPLNIAFALLFITRGWYHVAEGLWANPGRFHLRYEGLHHILPITAIVTFAAAIWFLWQYLAQNRVTMRWGRVVAGLLAWVSVVAIIVYILYPGTWWRLTGTTADGQFVADPGGWLFLLAGAFYPLYSITGFLLLRESTEDIPDGRRQSAFYAGLGFLFLPAFIAIGELFYVDVWDWFGVMGRDPSTLGWPFRIAHYLAIASILPILAGLGMLIADWVKRPERAHARGHVIGLAITMLLPIASVGIGGLVFFSGGPDQGTARAAFSVFAAFQGIWAIPYPILVAFGMIRYQNESDQVKAGRDLRRFAMTSLFFTVFFAVTEGIEAIASNRFGTWIGLGSAAALTVALNPVQEKVMKSKLVGFQGETVQELGFYKEQVRRTLADGMMGPYERRFLQNLQKTMGITADTARKVEAEIRREMKR